MKIPDVFPLIFDYETNAEDRESKYELIRTIIDNSLADKVDFKTVIDNHKTIVCELSKLLLEEPDEIEIRLVDIYNYPEMLKEYRDSLEKYAYESMDDDPIDTDTESETETDSESETDQAYRKLVVVDSDRLQSLERIIAINSVITILVSIANIIGIYYTFNK